MSQVSEYLFRYDKRSRAALVKIQRSRSRKYTVGIGLTAPGWEKGEEGWRASGPRRGIWALSPQERLTKISYLISIFKFEIIFAILFNIPNECCFLLFSWVFFYPINMRRYACMCFLQTPLASLTPFTFSIQGINYKTERDLIVTWWLVIAFTCTFNKKSFINYIFGNLINLSLSLSLSLILDLLSHHVQVNFSPLTLWMYSFQSYLCLNTNDPAVSMNIKCLRNLKNKSLSPGCIWYASYWFVNQFIRYKGVPER